MVQNNFFFQDQRDISDDRKSISEQIFDGVTQSISKRVNGTVKKFARPLMDKSDFHLLNKTINYGLEKTSNNIRGRILDETNPRSEEVEKEEQNVTENSNHKNKNANVDHHKEAQI